MKAYKKRNRSRKYLSSTCTICVYHFGKPRKRKCLSCRFFYPENDYQIPEKVETTWAKYKSQEKLSDSVNIEFK